MVIRCLGLDILGTFPQAVGGYRYLYVAINKFTKWLEATIVVKINKQPTVKFIKSIICRFGVPNMIITDNRSQFTSSAFQGHCKDLGIKICYASVAHPESNGQVKSDNAEILKGLKTRTYDDLEKHGKKWIDDFRARYGEIGHHPPEPLGRHLSLWSTRLRSSSPRKSP
jgi:transposase InsO family protein